MCITITGGRGAKRSEKTNAEIEGQSCIVGRLEKICVPGKLPDCG